MKKTKCRSKKSNLNSAKGITLLALVITIIVLIILAGVSISALLGDDGIVEQAGTAEERTNSEGEIEQIQMAYNAELMNNKTSNKKPVTAQQLEDRLRANGAKISKTNPVKEIADGFQIKFENGRKYRINVANKDVTYVGGTGGVVAPAGMYSVNEEVTPAPEELFNVEKINEETAKITGIKTDYIRRVAKDHYYHIEHDDVDTTLVVPYQVAIDGKMYTVTEVNLDCINTIDKDEIMREQQYSYGSSYHGAAIPDVQRVIYPNTVTKIITELEDDYSGGYLTSWASHNILEEVVLSDNLTEIGDNVFDGCVSLTSITIPSSVTSIGRCAFYECTGLTSITIQNGVTSIGDYAFYRCTGLTSITIPSSVTSIGSSAFSSCTGLTNITILNGVTSIGSGAFYYCTGVTNITIPSSVTSIGNSAFSSCTGLTNITILNGVTSIGSYAFSSCTGITTITIPNSVTTMGERAFGSWTASQTINCQATSQPTNWHEKWNNYDSSTPCKATVNWGVSN